MVNSSVITQRSESWLQNEANTKAESETKSDSNTNPKTEVTISTNTGGPSIPGLDEYQSSDVEPISVSQSCFANIDNTITKINMIQNYNQLNMSDVFSSDQDFTDVSDSDTRTESIQTSSSKQSNTNNSKNNEFAIDNGNANNNTDDKEDVRDFSSGGNSKVDEASTSQTEWEQKLVNQAETQNQNQFQQSINFQNQNQLVVASLQMQAQAHAQAHAQAQAQLQIIQSQQQQQQQQQQEIVIEIDQQQQKQQEQQYFTEQQQQRQQWLNQRVSYNFVETAESQCIRDDDGGLMPSCMKDVSKIDSMNLSIYHAKTQSTYVNPNLAQNKNFSRNPQSLDIMGASSASQAFQSQFGTEPQQMQNYNKALQSTTSASYIDFNAKSRRTNTKQLASIVQSPSIHTNTSTRRGSADQLKAMSMSNSIRNAKQNVNIVSVTNPSTLVSSAVFDYPSQFHSTIRQTQPEEDQLNDQYYQIQNNQNKNIVDNDSKDKQGKGNAFANYTGSSGSSSSNSSPFYTSSSSTSSAACDGDEDQNEDEESSVTIPLLVGQNTQVLTPKKNAKTLQPQQTNIKKNRKSIIIWSSVGGVLLLVIIVVVIVFCCVSSSSQNSNSAESTALKNSSTQQNESETTTSKSTKDTPSGKQQQNKGQQTELKLTLQDFSRETCDAMTEEQKFAYANHVLKHNFDDLLENEASQVKCGSMIITSAWKSVKEFKAIQQKVTERSAKIVLKDVETKIPELKSFLEDEHKMEKQGLKFPTESRVKAERAETENKDKDDIGANHDIIQDQEQDQDPSKRNNGRNSSPTDADQSRPSNRERDQGDSALKGKNKGQAEADTLREKKEKSGNLRGSGGGGGSGGGASATPSPPVSRSGSSSSQSGADVPVPVASATGSGSSQGSPSSELTPPITPQTGSNLGSADTSGKNKTPIGNSIHKQIMTSSSNDGDTNTRGKVVLNPNVNTGQLITQLQNEQKFNQLQKQPVWAQFLKPEALVEKFFQTLIEVKARQDTTKYSFGDEQDNNGAFLPFVGELVNKAIANVASFLQHQEDKRDDDDDEPQTQSQSQKYLSSSGASTSFSSTFQSIFSHLKPEQQEELVALRNEIAHLVINALRQNGPEEQRSTTGTVSTTPGPDPNTNMWSRLKFYVQDNGYNFRYHQNELLTLDNRKTASSCSDDRIGDKYKQLNYGFSQEKGFFMEDFNREDQHSEQVKFIDGLVAYLQSSEIMPNEILLQLLEKKLVSKLRNILNKNQPEGAATGTAESSTATYDEKIEHVDVSVGLHIKYGKLRRTGSCNNCHAHDDRLTLQKAIKVVYKLNGGNANIQKSSDSFGRREKTIAGSEVDFGFLQYEFAEAEDIVNGDVEQTFQQRESQKHKKRAKIANMALSAKKNNKSFEDYMKSLQEAQEQNGISDWWQEYVNKLEDAMRQNHDFDSNQFRALGNMEDPKIQKTQHYIKFASLIGKVSARVELIQSFEIWSYKQLNKGDSWKAFKNTYDALIVSASGSDDSKSVVQAAPATVAQLWEQWHQEQQQQEQENKFLKAADLFFREVQKGENLAECQYMVRTLLDARADSWWLMSQFRKELVLDQSSSQTMLSLDAPMNSDLVFNVSSQVEADGAGSESSNVDTHALVSLSAPEIAGFKEKDYQVQPDWMMDGQRQAGSIARGFLDIVLNLTTSASSKSQKHLIGSVIQQSLTAVAHYFFNLTSAGDSQAQTQTQEFTTRDIESNFIYNQEHGYMWFVHLFQFDNTLYQNLVKTATGLGSAFTNPKQKEELTQFVEFAKKQASIMTENGSQLMKTERQYQSGHHYLAETMVQANYGKETIVSRTQQFTPERREFESKPGQQSKTVSLQSSVLTVPQRLLGVSETAVKAMMQLQRNKTLDGVSKIEKDEASKSNFRIAFWQNSQKGFFGPEFTWLLPEDKQSRKDTHGQGYWNGDIDTKKSSRYYEQFQFQFIRVEDFAVAIPPNQQTTTSGTQIQKKGLSFNGVADIKSSLLFALNCFNGGIMASQSSSSNLVNCLVHVQTLSFQEQLEKAQQEKKVAEQRRSGDIVQCRGYDTKQCSTIKAEQKQRELIMEYNLHVKMRPIFKWFLTRLAVSVTVSESESSSVKNVTLTPPPPADLTNAFRTLSKAFQRVQRSLSLTLGLYQFQKSKGRTPTTNSYEQQDQVLQLEEIQKLLTLTPKNKRELMTDYTDRLYLQELQQKYSTLTMHKLQFLEALRKFTLDLYEDDEFQYALRKGLDIEADSWYFYRLVAKEFGEMLKVHPEGEGGGETGLEKFLGELKSK